MEALKVRQLSVFLEDKTGELASVTEILSNGNISIKSLLLVDSTDFGILRLIVDDPDRAIELLNQAGLTVKENQVFAVKTDDEIGRFNSVAKMLSQAGINILYTYAHKEKDIAVFVFKVDRSDFNRAVEIMIDNNVELIKQDFFI